MKIKTRFAPSPTGYLHLGSIRTALYSWLYARHNKGKFVLRIENTDIDRSTEEAIKAIIESMNWLKLDWDEGPYYQTKRFERYNSVIENMLKNGTAYKCYCSKDRLENIRAEQISKGKKPRYDGFCRDVTHQKRIIDASYVVRFRNPTKGKVIFHDYIRGLIEFENQELDDLIIRRTDGSPTYNFCVVIDDLDMGITHVIRGEDHINNTPRQINILQALGAKLPIYAHVSMILDENGKKLSKRHNPIDIMQYRDNGYLPETLLNYLVRLGWSHGDQEIFSLSEMINFFNLEAINKSASIFNIKKLQWLNHYYINNLEPEYVAEHLKWHIKKRNINVHNGPNLINLIKLLGSRCKTLVEIANCCQYLYEDFESFDKDAAKKYLTPAVYDFLQLISDKLTNINDNIWNINNINSVIQNVLKEQKISLNEIAMPLRVAVTGTYQSPSLNATLEAIGRKRVLKRINKALKFIEMLK